MPLAFSFSLPFANYQISAPSAKLTRGENSSQAASSFCPVDAKSCESTASPPRLISCRKTTSERTQISSESFGTENSLRQPSNISGRESAATILSDISEYHSTKIRRHLHIPGLGHFRSGLTKIDSSDLPIIRTSILGVQTESFNGTTGRQAAEAQSPSSCFLSSCPSCPLRATPIAGDYLTLTSIGLVVRPLQTVFSLIRAMGGAVGFPLCGTPAICSLMTQRS
jgi:hypothetical protein